MYRSPHIFLSGRQSLVKRAGSESDLIRLLQGSYLRDEARYDKWGALGKVLLVQDIFQNNHIRPVSGRSLERLINSAFPRTFQSFSRSQTGLQRSAIRNYFLKIQSLLLNEGMTTEKAAIVAREETAEKFRTSAEKVQKFLP